MRRMTVMQSEPIVKLNTSLSYLVYNLRYRMQLQNNLEIAMGM